MKTFDLVCEDDHTLDRIVEWNGDSPPRIIFIGETILYNVGRYLSPGDRYGYRIATSILRLDR